MDAVFNNTATEPVAVEVEKKTQAKQASKEKVRMMKAAIQETVQTDETFADKLRTMSDSFEVVNTLGYGEKGNIVEVKGASADGRQLKATSKIVGYKLRNVGTQAVEYTTEEFAQDETGKYVGTRVTKTFAPGETIDLSRLYMTMFCSKPEISFTLKNGFIAGGSSKKNASVREELASRYFRFSKNEDGTATPVNDDEVKIAIDDENGVIKPEYIATFGFLNNPKEGAARGPKGKSFTTQDLNANFVRRLIEDAGDTM